MCSLLRSRSARSHASSPSRPHVGGRGWGGGHCITPARSAAKETTSDDATVYYDNDYDSDDDDDDNANDDTVG